MAPLLSSSPSLPSPLAVEYLYLQLLILPQETTAGKLLIQPQETAAGEHPHPATSSMLPAGLCQHRQL